MLNPLYKLPHLATPVRALCDSGAFQDINKQTRLTPENALKRQLKYLDHLRAITHTAFNYEAIAIYDQMAGVDEFIVNGVKVKMRGGYDTAAIAVQETLEAAVYYASMRHAVECPIIYI